MGQERFWSFPYSRIVAGREEGEWGEVDIPLSMEGKRGIGILTCFRELKMSLAASPTVWFERVGGECNRTTALSLEPPLPTSCSQFHF